MLNTSIGFVTSELYTKYCRPKRSEIVRKSNIGRVTSDLHKKEFDLRQNIAFVTLDLHGN